MSGGYPEKNGKRGAYNSGGWRDGDGEAIAARRRYSIIVEISESRCEAGRSDGLN